MSLKHKVSISIAHPSAYAKPIVESGTKQIRKRLLNFIFGEKMNVLVLTPGDSVETVEIREVKGGKSHE